MARADQQGQQVAEMVADAAEQDLRPVGAKLEAERKQLSVANNTPSDPQLELEPIPQKGDAKGTGEDQLPKGPLPKGTDVGLALSGGGIRSAAFSMGVLQKLHELPEKKFLFLSCVSGGGYTGAAYMDWKQRHKNNFDFNAFAQNMAKRSGYIFNWGWTWCGLGPIIDLLCLVIMLALWLALTICVVSSCAACIAHFIAFLLKDLQPSPVGKLILVLAPIGGAILFSIIWAITYCVTAGPRVFWLRDVCGILSWVFVWVGGIVGIVFLDSDIYDHTQGSLFLALAVGYYVTVWLRLSLVSRLGLATGAYMLGVASLVNWRLGQGYLGGFEWEPLKYRADKWNNLMLICGSIVPMLWLLIPIKNSVFFRYYQWRLQKAFFTSDSAGCLGLAGVGAMSLFSTGRRFRDITVQPTFICNTTIAEYKLEDQDATNYAILSLVTAPTAQAEGDPPNAEEDPTSGQDIGARAELLQSRTLASSWAAPAPGVFNPPNPPQAPEASDGHVDIDLAVPEMYLSEGMAASGSAFAFSMGDYNGLIANARFLISTSGLALGSWFPSFYGWKNRSTRVGMWCIVISFLLHACLAMFFVQGILLAVYHPRKSIIYVPSEDSILLLNCIPFASLFIGVLLTSGNCSFARELLATFPLLRSVRLLLGITYVGKDPRQVFLSDGGHTENLALLPLLKRELSYIFVTEGIGGASEDGCVTLRAALQIARTQLGCQFSCNGVDVDHAILSFSGGSLPYLRINVTYYGGKKGLMFYLRPRGDRMRKYAGCCCDCCKNPCLSPHCNCACSDACGHHAGFCAPNHSTAYQFFSEKLFEHYANAGNSAIKVALKENRDAEGPLWPVPVPDDSASEVSQPSAPGGDCWLCCCQRADSHALLGEEQPLAELAEAPV